MYRLSVAAARDVEQILERSMADFGWSQTERYYASLRRCLDLLGENPAMGMKADELKLGYRRMAHESHVIFYRLMGDGILIVRILHKRMDVGRKFRTD